jgi:hypothetical protein
MMASSEDAGGLDIKGLVFSVTAVLMLVVSGASFLFVPIDDSLLIMDAGASPSASLDENETVWLDAYRDPANPIAWSQTILANGTTYKITVEGTWSNWGSQVWYNLDDPPVGPFEAAPMYPGLGGEKTGPVGADPFWMFAIIFGEDYAIAQNWWPLPTTFGFRIDLGGESGWTSSIRPDPDVYSPTHIYEVTVVGKGEIIGFWLPDYESSDNYGMFKIVISPSMDTDGDGLLDDWEKDGIDIDSDGAIDLNLKTLGADWQHKDVFVEIDYMDGLRPDAIAINNVQIAFSKAPVNNPDSKTGINLHVLVDQKIEFQPFTLEWGDFDNYYKPKYFGTLADQSSPNKAAILEAKKQVYHYCLFVNALAEFQGSTVKINGYSGVGERPGNDFMVALGNLTRWPKVQAGCFMHELGHNLGLDHGGQDGVNCKPNYLSVMNYLFQFDSLVPNRPLDYSRTILSTLDESNLTELNGVGVDYVSAYFGGWLFTGHKDPSQNKTVPSLLRPIDWDGDHHYNQSVQANVNDCTDINIGYSSPPNELLNGSNDWDNIILPFQNLPKFADGVHGQILEEDMTTDTIERMMEAAQNYHEVALENATPSSTIIDRNSILDVTVTSANLGASNETVGLSVYVGTTLIAQRTVSLERCNITSTTLRCDVSAVPKGNQVITIRLAQVPGEEDTFDNNFTYGEIEFTGETAPESNADQSWPLVVGVSVAAVALIAMALFVVLRKRGKKND